MPVISDVRENGGITAYDHACSFINVEDVFFG